MVKRTCLCCGKEFDYCPTCEKYKGTPMSAGFDCEECKEIFNIVSGHNIGVVTLDDVKAVLDKYNIEDVSVYKGVVKEILMKATTPAPAPKKVEEVVTDNKNVDIDLKEKKSFIKKATSKGISK